MGNPWRRNYTVFMIAGVNAIAPSSPRPRTGAKPFRRLINHPVVHTANGHDPVFDREVEATDTNGLTATTRATLVATSISPGVDIISIGAS